MHILPGVGLDSGKKRSAGIARVLLVARRSLVAVWGITRLCSVTTPRGLQESRLDDLSGPDFLLHSALSFAPRFPPAA